MRRTAAILAMAALAGCHCSADEPAPHHSTDDGAAPADTITRRLSGHELARSLNALTGVVPASIERLPPDSLGHSFDRVVEAQTMSRAHLDAFFDIATELADTLVADARLDEIAPLCTDAILPPVRSSANVEVIGATLGLGPDWSVQPDAQDPTIARTIYAPDPAASASYGFPEPGLYTVSLEVDVENGPVDTVEGRLGGQVMGTWTNGNGPEVFSYDVVIDAAETVVLDWDFSTDPDYHNLAIAYQLVRIEGPQDPNAQSAAADRRACASQLVDTLAPKAFRRPVTQAERDRLMGLYDEGAGDGASGFRMVLQGIFTSSSFLYLIEEGTPAEPGIYALNDHEIAARLSYALCELPPDGALTADAGAGELHTADQIEGHARRLLASCGQDTVRRFFSHWLELNRLDGLNKSPEAFPEFDDEVRAGLIAERDAYIDGLFWDQSATVEQFFSYPSAWTDPRSAFLSNSERRGILEQPALLAVTAPFDETSPVHRGVFVLEQVLCRDIPPPPAGVSIAPPPPDPSLSTRERWAAHSSEPQCRTCHQEIDPIGFLFEEYDGIGQFRTLDGVHPVDATGGVPVLGIADGLEGVGDLVDAVAGSDELAHCFATQLLRFSLGRLEQDRDAASIDEVAATAGTESMQEALIAVVRSPSFRHRYELPGGAP